MKQITGIFTIIVILTSSCKKENEEITSATMLSKIPPVIYAGSDTIIYLDRNDFTLSGSFSPIGNLDRVEWKLLKDQPCLFENQNSLMTKVSDLHQGFYQFELSAFDKNNVNVRDTVSLITLVPTLTENTFYAYGLTWIFHGIMRLK